MKALRQALDGKIFRFLGGARIAAPEKKILRWLKSRFGCG